MASTERGNFTGGSYNKTLAEMNDAIAQELIPAMLYVGILMALGVLGNFLVCFVFSFRLRMGTQHFLIVCLAVFDLLSCFIAMPSEIVDMRYFLMFDNQFACRLLRFINSYCAFASILTLVVIAVDRFRKVCQPMKRQMSLRHVRMALVAVLLVALVFAIPAAILYGTRTTDTVRPGVYSHDCSTNDQMKDTAFPLIYNSILFLAFLTLLVTLSVLYAKIWREMKRHSRYMARNSDAASIAVKGITRADEFSAMTDGYRRVSSVCHQFSHETSTSCHRPRNGSAADGGQSELISVSARRSSRPVGRLNGASERAACVPHDMNSRRSDASQVTFCDAEHEDRDDRRPSDQTADGLSHQQGVPHSPAGGPSQAVDVREDTGSDSDVFVQNVAVVPGCEGHSPDCHIERRNQSESTDNSPNASEPVLFQVWSGDHCDGKRACLSEHQGQRADKLTADIPMDTGTHADIDPQCRRSVCTEPVDGESDIQGKPVCRQTDGMSHSATSSTRRKHSFNSRPRLTLSVSRSRPETDYDTTDSMSTYGATWRETSDVTSGGPAGRMRTKRCLQPSLSVSVVKNTKATVIAFSVTVVFFLSFVPHLSLTTVRIIQDDFDRSLHGAALVFYNIFLRSYFVNSASNPIIYGVLNSRFRAECVRLLRELVTCRRHPVHPAVSNS